MLKLLFEKKYFYFLLQEEILRLFVLSVLKSILTIFKTTVSMYVRIYTYV